MYWCSLYFFTYAAFITRLSYSTRYSLHTSIQATFRYCCSTNTTTPQQQEVRGNSIRNIPVYCKVIKYMFFYIHIHTRRVVSWHKNVRIRDPTLDFHIFVPRLHDRGICIGSYYYMEKHHAPRHATRMVCLLLISEHKIIFWERCSFAWFVSCVVLVC